MDDICNFIPPKPNQGSISYFHFVYETHLRKLKQPFLHADYYVYLIYKGSGHLKINGKEYALSPGTLFFTEPYQAHEIIEDEPLSYLYISFNGSGVSSLLSASEIDTSNFLYQDFSHLFSFWMTSIRRINFANANTLTESVLMYTLSYVNTEEKDTSTDDSDRFERILDYISSHFTAPGITLRKVADIFFYNEKYLSALFVKKTGIKFTDHLNQLRIQHAVTLIKNHSKIVSEIAEKCGYNDPFYFSKIFKKQIGVTPTAFIKEQG